MVIDGMHYNPNCNCKGCRQTTRHNNLNKKQPQPQLVKTGIKEECKHEWIELGEYDNFLSRVEQCRICGKLSSITG
jgi:hypothetical protein